MSQTRYLSSGFCCEQHIPDGRARWSRRFLGLLSLIAYVRYVKAPSSSRYACTAITLALGLLAKPMLVTWPFVMLLLDYWPLRRWRVAKGHLRGASHREAATGIAPLVWEKLPL